MKLKSCGKSTLAVDIVQISTHGIWLLAKETEYFLPYSEYPWFRNSKISQIHNVQLTGHGHLHWPELDIDLELDSLACPEKYPLIYR